MPQEIKDKIKENHADNSGENSGSWIKTPTNKQLVNRIKRDSHRYIIRYRT